MCADRFEMAPVILFMATVIIVGDCSQGLLTLESFEPLAGTSLQELHRKLRSFENYLASQGTTLLDNLAKLNQSDTDISAVDGLAIRRVLEQVFIQPTASVFEHLDVAVAALKPVVLPANCIGEAFDLITKLSTDYVASLLAVASYVDCVLADKCYRMLPQRIENVSQACTAVGKSMQELGDNVGFCSDTVLDKDEKFASMFRLRGIAAPVSVIGQVVAVEAIVLEKVINPACVLFGVVSLPDSSMQNLGSRTLKLLFPADMVVPTMSTPAAPIKPTFSDAVTRVSPAGLLSTRLATTSTTSIRGPLRSISERLIYVPCQKNHSSALLLPSEIPTIASAEKLMEASIEPLGDDWIQPNMLARAVLTSACRTFPRFRWRAIVTPYDYSFEQASGLRNFSAYHSCDDSGIYRHSGSASLLFRLDAAGLQVYLVWKSADVAIASECNYTSAISGAISYLTEMLADGNASTRQLCLLARNWTSAVCGTSGVESGTGLLIERDQDMAVIALSDQDVIVTGESNEPKNSKRAVTFLGGILPKHRNAMEVIGLLRDVFKWEQLYQAPLNLLAACSEMRVRLLFGKGFTSMNQTHEIASTNLIEMMRLEELGTALISVGEVVGSREINVRMYGIEAQREFSEQDRSDTWRKSVKDHWVKMTQSMADAYRSTRRMLRENASILIESGTPWFISAALNVVDRLRELLAIGDWIAGFGHLLAEGRYLHQQSGNVTELTTFQQLHILANGALSGFRSGATLNGTSMFKRFVQEYFATLPQASETFGASVAELDQHTLKWKLFLQKEVESLAIGLTELMMPKKEFAKYRALLQELTADLTFQTEVDRIYLPTVTQVQETTTTMAHFKDFSTSTSSTIAAYAEVIDRASRKLFAIEFVRSHRTSDVALFSWPLFSFFNNLLISAQGPSSAVKGVLIQLESATSDISKQLLASVSSVSNTLRSARSTVENAPRSGLIEGSFPILSRYISTNLLPDVNYLLSASEALRNTSAAFAAVKAIASQLNVRLSDTSSGASEGLTGSSIAINIQHAKRLGKAISAACLNISDRLPGNWKSMSTECFHAPSFILHATVIGPGFRQKNSSGVENGIGCIIALDYLKMLERFVAGIREGNSTTEQIGATLLTINDLLDVGRSPLPNSRKTPALSIISAKAENLSKVIADQRGPVSPQTNSAFTRFVNDAQLITSEADVAGSVYVIQHYHAEKTFVRGAAAVLLGQLTEASQFASSIESTLALTAGKAKKKISAHASADLSSAETAKKVVELLAVEMHVLRDFFLAHADQIEELALLLNETVVADFLAFQRAREDKSVANENLSRLVSEMSAGAYYSIARMVELFDVCTSAHSDIHETVSARHPSGDLAQTFSTAVDRWHNVALAQSQKFMGIISDQVQKAERAITDLDFAN